MKLDDSHIMIEIFIQVKAFSMPMGTVINKGPVESFQSYMIWLPTWVQNIFRGSVSAI